MSLKLFAVTCRGIGLGPFYVVAGDPNSAYVSVRDALDRGNYGYRKDRELRKIELLAEDTLCPDCESRLFVAPPVALRGTDPPMVPYDPLKEGR